MASQTSVFVFTAILAGLIGSSAAYQFYVGGRKGWGNNPLDNYNQWAEKMRFQINDTLFFRYKNGEDSVLVVNRGDYDGCITKNPVEKFDGGDSIVKFDRSGPFYFISGHGDKCQKGQKLVVVVLADRSKSPPSPSLPPPSPSFPHHAPAPAQAPGGENISPAPVPPPHRSAASGVSRPSVLMIILLSIAMSKFGLF